MEIEYGNRACSIRAEHPQESTKLLGLLNQAAPVHIDRAVIVRESSARAELFNVETVDIGLEVHN